MPLGQRSAKPFGSGVLRKILLGICGKVIQWPHEQREEERMSQWMTTSEVVDEFRVSDRTVRRAVEEGLLHPVRQSSARNAKMRFQRSEVEGWIGIPQAVGQQ